MRAPLHPLLVATVPIVSMYAVVPGISRLDEVLLAVALALAASALLLGLAGAACRDLRKGALLVSVLLIVFFSFERLYGPIETWEIAGFRPGRRRYVLPLTYLGLAAFAVWLYRLRRDLAVVTALVNLLALGALVPPALTLGASFAGAARAAPADPAPPAVTLPERLPRTPDIYYFVFDRYGDERTLRDNGVDIEPFYAWLRERGFYVARESRSNYLKTVLSLASSLNLSYLDGIAAAEGPASGNWLPVYRWVSGHQVGAALRARGYEYVHLGSWYWPTRDNPQATRSFNYYVTVPRPVMQLFDTPFVEPLQRALGPALDQRAQQWHRMTRQVEDLLALAPSPGPKFVFFHALVPHHPYVFEPDGRFVTLDEESRRSREANYANQVRAANRMMQRVVERILAVSAEPPVIVLQGDEGPYPRGTEATEYEWRRATREQLRVKSGILNAFYLPCARDGDLYPRVSPVNAFRVVFNTCFGTALPLLPDRVYRHASDIRPYALDDITDALRPGPAQAAVRTPLP